METKEKSSMRRKEREIKDREAIDAIIRECRVCRLGLSDGGQPYVVPLSFGYDGESFYFHGASTGRKIDILRANNRVCFELDILGALRPSDEACRWSAGYRSVIGFGIAEIVELPEAKRKILGVIMAQYSDETFSFTDEAVHRTTVIKVHVDSITGKQS
jgi:uncharacterized protein